MEIAEQNPMLDATIHPPHDASMEISHQISTQPTIIAEQLNVAEPLAATDPPPPPPPAPTPLHDNKFLVSGTIDSPSLRLAAGFDFNDYPHLCVSSGGLLKAIKHGSSRGRPESC